MTGRVLPGAGSPQTGFFEGSRKGLNGRFGRLDLTRAGLVAGHFGVKKLHPEELILADLE
jgi:hypothetical protein